MQLDNYYYWFKSIITKEDCNRIIELGEAELAKNKKNGRSTNASTAGNMSKQDIVEGKPLEDKPLSEALKTSNESNLYIRDSTIAWLNDQWLYDLIVPHIHKANLLSGWNWEIDSYESFQFTKYSEGQFYGWHNDGRSDTPYKRYIHGVTPVPLNKDGRVPYGYVRDSNMVGKIRKISMTLNLCETGLYDGGMLKFDFGHHRAEEFRFHECKEIDQQGSMIVFPSFLQHCVTPVTKGTRYSLVLWSLGAPWK